MNTKMKLPLLKKNSGKLVSSLTFVLCILRQGIKPGIGFKFVVLLLASINWIQPVKAEGSRNLYPSGVGGSRAHLEWQTSSWGPGSTTNLARRTLLQVYAKAGENILVGSTAMGVGTLSNILIVSSVSGRIGNETLGTTVLNCRVQRSQFGNGTNGKISSRAEELAGPLPTTGGYKPCSYTVPSDGIYYVVFYAPAGGSSNQASSPSSTVEFGINYSDPDASNSTSILAWDVTVRNPSSGTPNADINGRVFADYLSLFTGGNLFGANDRPVNSIFYIVTKDGFHYQTDLKGIDPNGFVIYGNDIGFYDSDGATPLYHNLFATGSVPNGTMNTVDGGTSLALPSHKIFFSNPDFAPGTSDSKFALGIPLSPTLPKVNSSSFTGKVSLNTTKLNNGGTFNFDTTFNATMPGTYYIVIDQNISSPDYNANKSTNRLLRGRMTSAGPQTVNWDGKDNSGNFFPLGTNYPFKTVIGVGEYHFPLIDAESSLNGGPQFTILNVFNPEGGYYRGFYDDRGYKTIGGTTVGKLNTILCSGIGSVPNPAFSDPLVGFDTRGTNRAYGISGPGVNTNVGCTGSFGDAKGLDLWTYVSSPAVINYFNIISVSKLLMVKRITAVNGVPINEYVNDLTSTDDNNANWPTPLSTYLRGIIDGGTVKPGDEIEYTIYFLSSGETPVTNVNFCDLVPENTTFLPTSFNKNIVSSTDRDGGLSTADYGMMLQIGTTTPTIKYLSNIVDSPDRGKYLTPGTAIPTTFNCTNNTNGAVLVNIVNKTTPPATAALPGETLPNATGAGTPADSYGFVRFRALVK